MRITRDDLIKHSACAEGLAAFDAKWPDGWDYTPESHSVALGDSNLARFEAWAVNRGLIPGVVLAGGYGARVSGGYGARVSGGDRATVSGGDHAGVSGGYGATVSGGYGATVSGGDHATVTGGDGATVSGGDHATLLVSWWDGPRRRVAVAYVGEDGIEPNTRYRVDAGVWVRA